MEFHHFPRFVVQTILDFMTPVELSGMDCYLNGIKSCKEKSSLLYSIAKLLVLKTDRKIDAKLIPMLMQFHALPKSAVEIILAHLTQADMSALVWYLGPTKQCNEKASLLNSIAKASQLKTYKFGLCPKQEPLLLWGSQQWGLPKKIKLSQKESPPKNCPIVSPSYKKRKFVLAYKCPSSLQTVGPRGLDNRPAWITRTETSDFFLIGPWGIPHEWYDSCCSNSRGGEGKCCKNK